MWENLVVIGINEFPISLYVTFDAMVGIHPMEGCSSTLQNQIQNLKTSFIFIQLVFYFPVIRDFLATFLMIFIHTQFHNGSDIQHRSYCLMVVYHGFQRKRIILCPHGWGQDGHHESQNIPSKKGLKLEITHCIEMSFVNCYVTILWTFAIARRRGFLHSLQLILLND